jgi:serine/threonine protein kinase
MTLDDADRSKKHSQDKVLRAFLEHVSGTFPASKAGTKSGPPAPEEPKAEESAGPSRPPPASGTHRRVSMKYQIAAEEAGPPREKRHESTTGARPIVRTPGKSAPMSHAPTEIRPSSPGGVMAVPGDVARTPSGQVAAIVVPQRTEPPPSVETVASGSVLGGKYRLSKLLGRGGVGEVYEALHDVIGLRVAVKLIRFEYAGNSELSARFLQEARAAASVGHPGIVQIHDVGTSNDGRTYLVMEYLDGEDMEKLLARQRQLQVGEAAAILIEVLDALAAAHAKGIVHRDMKPENVFLVPGRKGERLVKLLDFGIARLADEAESTIRLTRPGAVMGTPYYMSPEQARGEQNVDSGVDIYAVGVMLYEALTGRLPYTGSNYNEVLSKVLTDPFPRVRALRADVPEEIEQVIQKATARNRSERYADAGEFADALTPFRPQRVMITLVDQTDAEKADARSPSVETPLPTTARSTAVPPPPRRSTPTAPSGRVPAVVAGVSAATEVRKRRGRVAVLVGVGLGLAVLVGIGVFFGLRSGSDQAGEPTPAAGSGGGQVVPASVQIRVLGVPAAAKVKFDGQDVGATFSVPAAPEEHTVEVSAPGRPTVVRIIRPTTDLTLDLAVEFGAGAPP